MKITISAEGGRARILIDNLFGVADVEPANKVGVATMWGGPLPTGLPASGRFMILVSANMCILHLTDDKDSGLGTWNGSGSGQTALAGTFTGQWVILDRRLTK